VALRSGVPDPVAQEIAHAAYEPGFKGVQRVATNLRILITYHYIS